jgi:hypothetical protein
VENVLCLLKQIDFLTPFPCKYSEVVRSKVVDYLSVLIFGKMGVFGRLNFTYLHLKEKVTKY